MDVTDKGQRVANYHNSMIHHLVELLEVAGINHTEEVMPWHINRRTTATEIKTYFDIYDSLEEGCLLSKKTIPEKWQRSWNMANIDTWALNPVPKLKKSATA